MPVEVAIVIAVLLLAIGVSGLFARRRQAARARPGELADPYESLYPKRDRRLSRNPSRDESAEEPGEHR